MIIYAVTSGVYSDYGIEQLFSTREKAQHYIDLSVEYGKGDFNDIDEYELDPEIKVPCHKYKYFYYVEMDRDGNIPDMKDPDDIRWIVRQQEVDVCNPDTREYTSFNQNYQNNKIILKGVINADSREHAIKLMGEKRQRLLRQDLWPADMTKDQMYKIINTAYDKYGEKYDIVRILEESK